MVAKYVAYQDENKAWFEKLETIYKRKDIIDLEGVEITRPALAALSEFLAKNRSRFWHRIFNTHPRIKEIKSTTYSADVRPEDFKPLVEAFKKNTGITSFTTDYTIMSDEDEQVIRLQLMLNKSRLSIMGKKFGLFWDTYYYYSIAWGVAECLVFVFPTLSIIKLTLIAMPLLFGMNRFLDTQLKAAKQYDFSKKEIIDALKPGQACADGYKAFLMPSSWTPLAYLGYSVESNEYQTRYKITQPCFNLKPR